MEIRYRIAPLIARMHNKLLKYFGASLQLLTSLSRLRRCFCTPRVKRFSVRDSKRRDNQLHRVLGRFTHDRSVRSILHRPERDGQARLAPAFDFSRTRSGGAPGLRRRSNVNFTVSRATPAQRTVPCVPGLSTSFRIPSYGLVPQNTNTKGVFLSKP